MKKLFFVSIILTVSINSFAQTSIDLSGKKFKMSKNTAGSTSELKFLSNKEVVYIITSFIGGKTYIDECPGKSSVQGNKISIVCMCSDKEIYPDPIKDNFTYDSKSAALISTSYRNLDGKNIIWEEK